MGLRTSVYLSDELAAMWKASGIPLAELVRRGLAAGGPVDEATLRRVLDEKLSGLSVVAADRAPYRYEARGYGGGDYESEPYEEIP